MGYFAGARDLRNLLAVAAMLRRLAEDSLHRSDRKLYHNAAEALEGRARDLAASPPPGQQDDTEAHRAVDIFV